MTRNTLLSLAALVAIVGLGGYFFYTPKKRITYPTAAEDSIAKDKELNEKMVGAMDEWNKNHPKQGGDSDFVDTFKVNSLATALQRHAARIAHYFRDGSGELQGESEAIVNSLEKYKSAFFTLNQKEEGSLKILIAPNKQFGLVSWFWREGSEYVSNGASVIKTDDGQIKVLSLGTIENSPHINFDKIGAIPTQQGSTLYFGLGTSDSGDRHTRSRRLILFQIKGSQLIAPKLLPKQQSSIGFDFNVHDVGDNRPDFVVEENGQLIKVPILEPAETERSKDGSIFKGKYNIYRFDGTQFLQINQ